MTAQRKISVASRAHRALRGNPRYKKVSSVSDALDGYQADKGKSVIRGEPIGVYENPVGTEPRKILITEAGIATAGSNGIRWIAFDEIAATSGPTNKLTDNAIAIALRSGVRVDLRIAGADGRFKDIFGFVRFLDRVLADRAAER